jgi:hypothetical protein
MKKLLLSMATVALLFTSCSDDSKEVTQQEQEIDMSDFYVYTDANSDETSKSVGEKSSSKSCASMTVLNRQLSENPGLEKKMYNIELHTRKFIAGKGKPPGVGNGGGDGGTVDNADYDVAPVVGSIITIPVNVIIVYTNADDITDKQIGDQIKVLNADFNTKNIGLLPSGTTFENDVTTTDIMFELVSVERHNDRTKFWGTNDSVKFAYPPTEPENKLNIWVCNISRSILGYAQFPGGNPATDGIVIGGDYFGITSGAYGLGRTATHEIGHYLNLRHIWGDGGCTQDDFVVDTPISDRSNSGCPTYPTVHCNTPDMTMNYMDYTYDQCMYMFTDGQRNRMRAIFEDGGDRALMAGN